MSGVNSIKTEPLKATTILSRDGRTGASSGAFPLSTAEHPGLKEIPTILPPEKVQIVSSATLDVVGLASDMVMAERSLYGPLLPGMSHPTSIVADQAAAGSTSLSATPRAILKIIRGSDKFKKSQAIGDEAGQISARIEQATGFTWTLGAVTSVGAKTTKILSSFVSNPRLVAGGALLSFIGGIFSVALNALFLIGTVRLARRATQFYQEFKSQGKNFEALAGSIYVSSEKMHEWIAKDDISLRSMGTDVLEKAGIDTAMARARFAHLDPARKLTMFRTLVQHLTKEDPSLAAMAEFYFSQLSERDIDSLDLPAALGLLDRVANQQLVNESHFEQAFGSDSLNLVKKATETGLQARLSAAAPDAVRAAAKEHYAALLAKIDASYEKTQSVYTTTIALTFIGAVLGAVGLFTLGPIGLAIVAGIALAGNLGAALQSLVTREEFKGPVGRYDKAFIYACMALTILGIAGAITAFLVFGGAPIVFGLALTAAVITLCVYGFGLYKLNKQQKEWEKGHPDVTVDDLIARLNNLRNEDAVDEETLKMLKQLPKDHRKAIVDIAAEASRQRRIRFNDLDNVKTDRLRRAVQKATSFYWKQWWYSHKHPYFEQQALQLQELLASIKNNDMARANHIFHREIEDPEVKDKVQKYFHRISATEASVDTLKCAVHGFRKHEIAQIA